MMLRQGTCNRCGQCCGAPGGPDRRTPFDRRWPDTINRWEMADVTEMCPFLSMFGLTGLGEDMVGLESPTGNYRVQGVRYYYVWVPDLGVQRDTSAAHDGSEYEPECPFLLPDPGDGTRPCGLVGTNDDGSYKLWCEQEPISPRSEENVAEWVWSFPGCSYTWIPE